MIVVKLPAALRRHAGGAARLELPGSTVGDCLDELERRFPAVSAELRGETGTMVPSVYIYVNGQDVRYLAGLETPVQEGDEIAVLMPVAGGRGRRRRGDTGTRGRGDAGTRRRGDTETWRRGDAGTRGRGEPSPALRALTARSLPSSLPLGEANSLSLWESVNMPEGMSTG